MCGPPPGGESPPEMALVAYAATGDSAAGDSTFAEGIREYLAQRLPAFMGAGGGDGSADLCPAPPTGRSTLGHCRHRNEERPPARAWLRGISGSCDWLASGRISSGCPRWGVSEDFFQLGGTFPGGLEIGRPDPAGARPRKFPLATLMLYPTIEGLAGAAAPGRRRLTPIRSSSPCIRGLRTNRRFRWCCVHPVGGNGSLLRALDGAGGRGWRPATAFRLRAWMEARPWTT